MHYTVVDLKRTCILRYKNHKNLLPLNSIVVGWTHQWLVLIEVLDGYDDGQPAVDQGSDIAS